MQNHNICSRNVTKFKYLAMTVTDQNFNQELITD
jgi:hypothetical protein